MHLLTQSALLQALGWSLFNSLWQMGLLWLLYQLFILIFSNMSADVRHGILLTLLVTGTGWSALSFATTYLAALNGTGTPSAFPIRPIRELIASMIPYGSSLYLLILTGLLTKYFYFYFSSTRLTRRGLSRIAPEYRVFVEQTARQMGVRRKVSIWLSSLVDVPVTLGFVKPVILLPLALCNNLTTAQVEAILVHELAHIRRNDFLLNLVVTLLEGLFFFNPFVRRLIADLRKEREHCCDDQVLQFRYDPHSYVSALLALANGSQRTALAMAATGDSGDKLLLQRAKRILLQQRSSDRPGPFALLFLILLLVVLNSVGLTRQTRPIPAQDQPKTTEPVATKPAETVPAKPAAAVAVELAQNHIIFNHTANIPPTQPARKPKPKANHDPVSEEKLLLINTVTEGDFKAPEELVAIIQKGSRSFSIGQPKTEIPEQAREKGLPFVPNASFTFRSIEEDTLRPEEKLARLQMETQREIALSMQRLQLDLMAQLDMIKRREQQLAESNTQEGQENLKQQRALIEQQLHLQKAYIQKLDQLQRGLKKARRLTIVYI